MRRIEGVTVKEWLRRREDDFESVECKMLAKRLGRCIAKMHSEAGLVHGDLTTSNFMVEHSAQPGEPRVFVLDFGLSYYSTDEEDFAVDLYVLERSRFWFLGFILKGSNLQSVAFHASQVGTLVCLNSEGLP
jgi:TP53 regulating kinase-like protein